MDDTGVVLSQTVLGLTVGRVYVLEFWAGGEDLGSFPIAGVFGLMLVSKICICAIPEVHRLQALADDSSCSSLPIPQHILSAFTNWGHMCSSRTELILDDVRLYDRNHWQKLFLIVGLLVFRKTCIQMHWYTPTRLPTTLPFLWVEMNSSISHCMMLLHVNFTERIFQGKQLPTGNLSKGIYYYEITTSSGLAQTRGRF